MMRQRASVPAPPGSQRAERKSSGSHRPPLFCGSRTGDTCRGGRHGTLPEQQACNECLRLRNLNASLEEKLQATEEAERTLRLELGALRRGHAAAATQVTSEMESQRLLATKLEALQPDMDRLDAIAAELESRICNVARFSSAQLTMASATWGKDAFVRENDQKLVMEDVDCQQTSISSKRDVVLWPPDEPRDVLDMAMVCQLAPPASPPERSSSAPLEVFGDDLDLTLGTTVGLSNSAARLLGDQELLEDKLLNSWRVQQHRGDTGTVEQSPGTPRWPTCPRPPIPPKKCSSRVRELTPESARRPQDEPRSTLRSCPPRLFARKRPMSSLPAVQDV